MKKILTLLVIFVAVGCSGVEIIDSPETKTSADTTGVMVADSIELSGVPIDFNVKIEDWE